MSLKPTITAARCALSLTVAVTYSNGFPTGDSVPSGLFGSMLGEAPLRAVSNETVGTGCPVQNLLSLLFFEFSGYYVSAVRLHIYAADVLVRRGVDREGFR